jgi:hypothetical protein
LEYGDECKEALKILKDIESQMDLYFRTEYEPTVPNCRTICGVFILNIQEFFNGTIEKWVTNNITWAENQMKEIFQNYARSTVINVIKRVVGSMEKKESMVRIAAESQLRELLYEEMNLV